MKEHFDNYTRLGKGLFGLSSLWMAPDHLVYVKGSGFLMPFTEEYKRFRFDEIQCFSLARTSRVGKGLLYLAGVLISGALVSLILGLNTGESYTATVAVFVSLFTVCGLVSLALLLRHLILGPTCVCEIQTSLSRERIRALTRFHQAKQAIGRVELPVRDSQSNLLAGATSDPAVTIENAAPNVRESFQVPAVVLPNSLVFVGLGLLSLASLHLESMLLVGLILLLLFAASLTVIMALIFSVRRPSPTSVRSCLWTQLGLLFLLIGSGSVYYLIAAIEAPEYTLGITGPLEALSVAGTEGGIVFYAIFLFLSLSAFAAGLVGAIQSMRWKQRLNLAASGRTVEKREVNDG